MMVVTLNKKNAKKPRIILSFSTLEKKIDRSKEKKGFRKIQVALLKNRASNLGLARKAAIWTNVVFDEVVFQGGLDWALSTYGLEFRHNQILGVCIDFLIST